MSHSATSSPPPTPSHSPIMIPGGYVSPPCICGSVPLASLSANTLADSLGVSPLYKQKDSARWNAAAQVYHNSRAHSPTQDGQFNFPDIPYENMWVNANQQQLVNNFVQRNSALRTPLSLEDIANMNRKRHAQEGGVIRNEGGGPLELEAIAAVHELSHEVMDISVSEMLPRTSDLIFVNVKTQEGQPYTLELTLKGWRIASSHTDCMNGDYTKVDLHTRYFRNARELLSFISPDHQTRFNECLSHKLKELAASDPTLIKAS